MKRKLHPVAKKMGYKTNDDFYKDFPTQEHFENHMANGGKVKYAEGAQIPTSPVTDIERDQWNQTMGQMKQMPGYSATNWDHNQDFQKQAMAATGFNPDRMAAVQADMLQRNQTMPGTVKYGPQGMSKADGWAGSQTKDQSYRKYEYTHYDKNNNEIGHIQPGFTPMTQQDMGQWAAGNRNQGMASPNNAPVSYDFSAPAPSPTAVKPLGLASNGFPTREEAIAKYKAKGGTPNAAPAPEYNIEDVRASTTNQGEMDMYNNKQYDMNGAVMARGGKIRIKKMGTGDIVSPDNPTGASLGPNLGAPTGAGPMGDRRYTSPVQVPTQQMEPINGTEPNEVTQENKTKKNFSVGAGLTIGTAPLIAGADMLVTNYLYNPQIKAAEANRARANMQKTQSPNDFIGADMLTYAQGGNIVDNYKMHPNMAKEEIEGGEGVQLPNGQFDVAQGPKHSEGGIPTNLPEDTRVFSDQLRADKGFSSELLGRKITKKITIADVAKAVNNKYDKKYYDRAPKDAITERSKDIRDGYKNNDLDQAFAYQEMIKDPMSHFMGEMAMGGKVRYDNGGTKYKKGFDQAIHDDQARIWNEHPDLVQEAYSQINPATGQPYGAPTSGIQNNIDGLDGPRYRYTRDYVNSKMMPKEQIDPLTPASLVPIIVPEIGPRLDDNSFRSVPTMYEAQAPELPEMQAEKTQGSGKIKKLASNIKFGEYGVSGLIPGAMAAINATTDYPINSGRYTPDYPGRPEELNIDPILNRNLAQARPYMTGNSGNASVDQARALQGLASVHNADEQAYANKFNVDGQSKQAWRNQVVQTKNQAEMINLQRQDDVWNKMTARESNKRQAFQEIANNAYTNSRAKLYEKHAVALANQLSPNYHYDPSSGFTYVEGPDGQFHAVPIGQTGAGGLYNNTDGVKTTIKRKKKSNGQSETTTTSRESRKD